MYGQRFITTIKNVTEKKEKKKKNLKSLIRFNGGGLVIKSCLALARPWTVACQAPLSMGFSRQEY